MRDQEVDVRSLELEADEAAADEFETELGDAGKTKGDGFIDVVLPDL